MDSENLGVQIDASDMLEKLAASIRQGELAAQRGRPIPGFDPSPIIRLLGYEPSDDDTLRVRLDLLLRKTKGFGFVADTVQNRSILENLLQRQDAVKEQLARAGYQV